MDEQPSSTPGRPDDSRPAAQPSSADAGTWRSADALARRMAGLARALQHENNSKAVLDHTVATAVALIPGAQHGAISLVRARRTVTTAAATSELARGFDALQTEVGQGPCLDSAFDHQTTRVDDLAAESTRWPALARRSEQVGVVSMLCLQLFVEGDNLGALNLLSSAPGAFGDESEHVGLLLATHAAIAVADAQKLEHVLRRLEHRDVIGQAKGILMERHKLSAQQAFDVLARFSQETNRKLHQVALELATSGELSRRRRG